MSKQSQVNPTNTSSMTNEKSGELQYKLNEVTQLHNDKVEFKRLGAKDRLFWELLIAVVYFCLAAFLIYSNQHSNMTFNIIMAIFYVFMGLVMFIGMVSSRLNRRIDLLAEIVSKERESKV